MSGSSGKAAMIYSSMMLAANGNAKASVRALGSVTFLGVVLHVCIPVLHALYKYECTV